MMRRNIVAVLAATALTAGVGGCDHTGSGYYPPPQPVVIVDHGHTTTVTRTATSTARRTTQTRQRATPRVNTTKGSRR